MNSIALQIVIVFLMQLFSCGKGDNVVHIQEGVYTSEIILLENTYSSKEVYPAGSVVYQDVMLVTEPGGGWGVLFMASGLLLPGRLYQPDSIEFERLWPCVGVDHNKAYAYVLISAVTPERIIGSGVIKAYDTCAPDAEMQLQAFELEGFLAEELPPGP